MKKISIIGCILTAVLLLLQPSYVAHCIQQENTTTQDVFEIITYNYKGMSIQKTSTYLTEHTLDLINTSLQTISEMNASQYEKQQLIIDLFNDQGIPVNHSSLNMLRNGSQSIQKVTDHNKNGLSSLSTDIEGFLGVLYGTFEADYEDFGFICLGYPFPFFNFCPLLFTGFGHGNLYFTGITYSDDFATQHLHFEEYVSLFSLFYLGTVVLLPLAYFGYMGFMFGFAFCCWGGGI